jgi:hypothetical protein
MNKYMGLNDQKSKIEAQDAEEELQLWEETKAKIKSKLKSVEAKLREIYSLPEKPQKKRNYALQKVKEPPSDNE